MSMNGHDEEILRTIFRPYETSKQTVNDDASVMCDLNVTGSDYFDLIEEIEKSFKVDLTDFLTKPSHEIAKGVSDRPEYRDFKYGELKRFLNIL